MCFEGNDVDILTERIDLGSMSSESDEADKPTSGFGGDNKSLRKLRKKETKEKQRANRQHDPKAVDLHRKTCDDCQNPKDVLIRCQADDSGRWYMLCTAGCWQKASGGQVDGSSSTPHYLYGGMYVWKLCCVGFELIR